MCWNIARRMKRSASVKLLGRGSAVTSSCMVFELRGRNLSCSNRCRVEGVSVVIEWWWHFKALEFARGMKRSASVKLLGRGSVVTSSKCCHRVVVAFKCSGTSLGA